MGCSNPHPHGQVWSMSAIPTLPAVEIASLTRYSQAEQPPSDAPKGPDGNVRNLFVLEYGLTAFLGRPCLLCEYAFTEVKLGERVVVKNEHWVALVPWWATWPFEILRAYSTNVFSLSI